MSYTAINIVSADREYLQGIVESFDLGFDFSGSDWDVRKYCHHMTVMMAPIAFPEILGKIVKLQICGFGVREETGCAAFLVYSHYGAGCLTANKTPHITAAVREGCKPVGSNEIKEFKPLVEWLGKGFETITVQGVVDINS